MLSLLDLAAELELGLVHSLAFGFAPVAWVVA